ncbi:MAG: ATP-binding protein [Phycicoccus sp.]|nr:ATP-binding protein [Phycicoccus sp.]NMM32916.1 ATP-binding protein [Phycicoccus sp.]
MAQPPNTTSQVPAGPVSRVRAQMMHDIVALEVVGRLSDLVEDLELALQLALAEGPRGVVCDLSAVLDGSEPDAIAQLATAGRHVRDWAAIPVAVACQDPQVRGELASYPLGRHLIVTATMASAVSEVVASPIPAVHWLRLAPHPTAPRTSRDFVTRALLDWRLGRVIPTASLVVSELVTNSTMYAGSDIALSVSWHLGALRLAVRDNSPRLPRQVYSVLDLHGRGLTIVAGLSRAFGVLPTSDGGKVVWAVLDASPPRTSERGSRVNPAGKGSPMVTAPNMLPQLARRPSPLFSQRATMRSFG